MPALASKSIGRGRVGLQAEVPLQALAALYFILWPDWAEQSLNASLVIRYQLSAGKTQPGLRN